MDSARHEPRSPRAADEGSRPAEKDIKYPMEPSITVSTIERIAFIGNYLPRQCGIATFTTDLCEAFAAVNGEPAVGAARCRVLYGVRHARKA